jgi:hypothetical protein
VRGKTHQINLELAQVDIDLASSLGGIDVENNALLAADFTQFGDRLNDADLVIDVHHRNQHGIRANRCLEDIQIKQAVLLDVEVSRLEALTLHFAHRVENCLVLGLHRDDVLPLVPA